MLESPAVEIGIERCQMSMKLFLCGELTSMLQKNTDTSLLASRCREMKQGPAVGIPTVGGISLLQHLAHGVNIAGGHGSLDLQLFLQLRVPPAVVV